MNKKVLIRNASDKVASECINNIILRDLMLVCLHACILYMSGSCTCRDKWYAEYEVKLSFQQTIRDWSPAQMILLAATCTGSE